MGTLTSSASDEDFSCASSTGLSQMSDHALFVSEKNITTLKQHLVQTDRSAVALSMWLKLAEKIPYSFTPIFTIGSGGSSLEPGYSSDCNSFFISIGQFEDKLFVQYQGLEKCLFLGIAVSGIEDLKMNNVVIQWASEYTSIYINGEPLLNTTSSLLDTSFMSLDETFKFRFFTRAGITGTFRGSIAQLSLFDQELVPEDAKQIYEKGLHAPEVMPLNISALSNSALSLAQDDLSRHSIELCSTVVASEHIKVWVQIDRIPKFGTLFDQNGNILTMGSLTSFPFNRSCAVVDYLLKSDSTFTVPKINWKGDNLHRPDEEFTYRFLASDVAQNVSGVSEDIAQYVDIIHVNHPPIWSLGRVNITDIGENESIISGIQLLDEQDLDIDRVRVDLAVNTGVISLPAAAAGLAIFDECSIRSFSSWQCVGNGKDDRSMTFVALPSDVVNILDGLVYKRSAPSADELTIRVWDGAGNDCLDILEHQRISSSLENHTSIRRECFASEIRLALPFDNATYPAKEAGEDNILGIPNSDFKNFGLADLIFWFSVISTFTCICMCGRLAVIHCLAGGARVHVDGTTSDHENDPERDSNVDDNPAQNV